MKQLINNPLEVTSEAEELSHQELAHLSALLEVNHEITSSMYDDISAAVVEQGVWL